MLDTNPCPCTIKNACILQYVFWTVRGISGFNAIALCLSHQICHTH